jgi:STE24 endopeptidase
MTDAAAVPHPERPGASDHPAQPDSSGQPAQPARRGSAHPPLARRTPYRAEDWFSTEELAEARRYAHPVNRLKLVRSVLSAAVLVALVFTKAVPRLLHHLGWRGWALEVLVASFVLTLADTVATSWISGYLQLSYDKRWGLSNQTPGRFVADQVKDVAISTLLVAALLTPVYAAIHATGLWWLWGWAGFMAVILAVTFIYPVAIMPRFNKFTPMPDGELRSHIEAVAGLAGTTIEGVYTMDASKRSTRGNAFVAGFGATKRVVVFDTILDYPITTIEQIVAHEIGHYRLKHIVKTVPFQGLLFLAAFAFVALVGRWHGLLRWAGVHSLGDPGAVPLFLGLFGVAWAALNLAQAWFSRFKEREADLEALELLGRPDHFLDVWRRMAPDNKVELEPSRWTRMNGTHPEVPERMAFGQAWAEQNGG